MAEKIIAEETSSKTSSDHTNVEALLAKPQKYILKLDLRLIPILGCTYTILFLDRTNSECISPLQSLLKAVN